MEGEDWPEEAGEVLVTLYWVNGSRRQRDGGESWDEYFHGIDIDLYLEVTCSLRGASATVTDIYHKVSSESGHVWKWSGWVERE